MSVTVEITSGLLAGRTTLVRLGQILRVGRTEWADLAVSGDRSLAEVHFAIEYDAAGCRVRDLGEWGLFVNGQAMPQAVLNDGDQLRAGDTTFRIRIRDDSASAVTAAADAPAGGHRRKGSTHTAASDLARVPHALAADIAARYTPSDDAKRLLKSDHSPRQFIAALVSKSRFADATRFLAWSLPARENVWWACLAARQSAASTAGEHGQAALTAAELWATDPSEANRRAAHAAAEAAGFDAAPGWAAMAAFWSGGSIAPIGLPDVPAGDGLTPQAVAAAVTLAATQRAAAEIAAAYGKIVAAGLEVADGKLRWPKKKS